MPSKRHDEQLAPDVRIVQFRPGELKPLFVKASDIDRVVIGLSPKTLANWRSLGVGPRYSIVNGSIYYKYSELLSFFEQNQVETFNDD